MQTQNDGNKKNTLIKITFFLGGGEHQEIFEVKTNFLDGGKKFFFMEGVNEKNQLLGKGVGNILYGLGEGKCENKIGGIFLFLG